LKKSIPLAISYTDRYSEDSLTTDGDEKGDKVFSITSEDENSGKKSDKKLFFNDENIDVYVTEIFNKFYFKFNKKFDKKLKCYYPDMDENLTTLIANNKSYIKENIKFFEKDPSYEDDITYKPGEESKLMLLKIIYPYFKRIILLNNIKKYEDEITIEKVLLYVHNNIRMNLIDIGKANYYAENGIINSSVELEDIRQVEKITKKVIESITRANNTINIRVNNGDGHESIDLFAKENFINNLLKEGKDKLILDDKIKKNIKKIGSH